LDAVIDLETVWIVLSGVLMGIANVIPGLSGGTLLLLMGTYTRFLDVFASLNLRNLKAYKWKENALFILLIGIGAVAGILGTSKVMSWLLEFHPVPLYLVLFGLIAGSLDVLTKKTDFKKTSSYVFMVIGAVFILLIFFLGHSHEVSNITVETANPLLLFTAGVVASATMVIPGISGSMILLLLGLYKPVVDSVSTMNILNILFIGIGAIIGIVAASKVIKILLEKKPVLTYSFLLGLVVASLIDFFPMEVFESLTSIITGIIALIFGIILGRMLVRLEKKMALEKTA
jgi:putative membrane protein